MALPKYNIVNCVHFITINTYKRIRLFKNEKNCQIIVNNLNFYRSKYGYKLIAYVVMPDHLHLLLLLNKKCNNISKVIQDFKSHSAKEIVYTNVKGGRKSLLSPYFDASKGSHLPKDYKWVHRGKEHTPIKNKIWQKSFYDFNIYSEHKLEQKLNYIHQNPVKAGFCKEPGQWVYSSYKGYVSK